MTRKSSIRTNHDAAGDYEVEIFDCPTPKRVIVCLHGRGVRRWDGEAFFYAVAEHCADSAVLLVDQFQHENDMVILNPLPLITERINGLIDLAKQLHPGIPIVAIAHSMGCGVATFINTADLAAIVLVTPAAGAPLKGFIKQYGDHIAKGKVVRNREGEKVYFTAAFAQSVSGVYWPDEYHKLVRRFAPIYVFEGGADDIIGEERLTLRDIPFTKYFVLDGAPHNLAGQSLADFFAGLDPLLAKLSPTD